MTIYTGIKKNKKNDVAAGLAKVLSETYTLYLKTQNYHWNIQGPRFATLHGLFETQYKALAEAVDEIAERIRILGEHAPGSFGAFQNLSAVHCDSRTVRTESSMLKTLAEDHELIARTARDVIQIAESAQDDGTADLMAARIRNHEKTAWMLRSHLEGPERWQSATQQMFDSSHRSNGQTMHHSMHDVPQAASA